MDQDIKCLRYLKIHLTKLFLLEEYGINLATKKDNIIIDTLKWNGIAKKSGFETDDILTEIKFENKKVQIKILFIRLLYWYWDYLDI